MRYKAAAKELKQVVGIADPVPAEAVLPRKASGDDGNQKQDNCADEIAVPDVAIVVAAVLVVIVGELIAQKRFAAKKPRQGG